MMKLHGSGIWVGWYLFLLLNLDHFHNHLMLWPGNGELSVRSGHVCDHMSYSHDGCPVAEFQNAHAALPQTAFPAGEDQVDLQIDDPVRSRYLQAIPSTGRAPPV